jgi:hypothetical protein
MAKTSTKTKAASKAPVQNKKDKVILLLRRSEGASIAEMVKGTGWLPHTTRAILTGLRKKGLQVEKSKVDGVTRYRITAEPAA